MIFFCHLNYNINNMTKPFVFFINFFSISLVTFVLDINIALNFLFFPPLSFLTLLKVFLFYRKAAHELCLFFNRDPELNSNITINKRNKFYTNVLNTSYQISCKYQLPKNKVYINDLVECIF